MIYPPCAAKFELIKPTNFRSLSYIYHFCISNIKITIFSRKVFYKKSKNYKIYKNLKNLFINIFPFKKIILIKNKIMFIYKLNKNLYNILIK